MNSYHCPTKTKRHAVHRPQYRTTQDDKGVKVQIALPGVLKDELNLTLLESNLRIEATRGGDVPDGWKTHRATEVPKRYGLQFRLTSRLDGTKATASFEAGVLTLHVPVREEARPRQIAVS